MHPLIVGDPKVDLEYPQDDQAEAVDEVIDASGMSCFTRYFGQRRSRLIRVRWTWRQRHRTRYISSKHDYFFGREQIKAKVRGCIIVMPRHHESDHRTVVTRMRRGSAQKL